MLVELVRRRSPSIKFSNHCAKEISWTQSAQADDNLGRKPCSEVSGDLAQSCVITVEA